MTSKFRFVLWAVGLYALWTLATYLLEGRILTLLRPEAVGARFAYALVGNIFIGVVGGGLVLRAAVRRTNLDPQRLGLRSSRRTALSVALGFGLGAAVFMVLRPVTIDPVIVGNAFAQVWVVSAAEVLVCWAVLGNAIGIYANLAQSRLLGVIVACVVSAIAFGVYHFAHSPPFNTAAMVGLLTVVGLATGAFFFGMRELYGTIVFHNFLALKGVTDALAEGGGITRFETPQVALLFTAATATGVLVAVDLVLRKSAASD